MSRNILLEQQLPGVQQNGTNTRRVNLNSYTNTSPVAGDLWNESNVLKYYNGSTTVDISTGGESITTAIVVATTASGYPADYYTDGTADEVQINQAITAANAAGGGIVHIRAGTYNCAANVVGLSNIILQGEGAATKLLFPGATHRVYFRDQTNFKVQYLQVDTTTKTSGDAQEKGIIVWGCTNFELAHNYLPSYAFGIFVCSSDAVCSKGYIHHNYIVGTRRNDCLGGGPLGDSDQETRDIIITNNHLIKDNVTTSNNYNSYDMTGVKGILFANNICQGNVLLGYERDPNYKCIIANNIVSPPSGTTDVRTTIYVQDTSNTGDVGSDVNITGNTILGGPIWVEGAAAQKSTGMQIVGNHIMNSTAYTNAQVLNIPSVCIQVEQATRALISGNYIDGGGATSGIVNDNASQVHTIGNYIYNVGTGMADAGTVTGNNYSNNYTNTVTTPSSFDVGSTENNNVDV